MLVQYTKQLHQMSDTSENSSVILECEPNIFPSNQEVSEAVAMAEASTETGLPLHNDGLASHASPVWVNEAALSVPLPGDHKIDTDLSSSSSSVTELDAVCQLPSSDNAAFVGNLPPKNAPSKAIDNKQVCQKNPTLWFSHPSFFLSLTIWY